MLLTFSKGLFFIFFWLFHLASLILPFASSHLRVVGQSEELKELNKETWDTLRGEKLKKEKLKKETVEEGKKEGLKELKKETWETLGGRRGGTGEPLQEQRPPKSKRWRVSLSKDRMASILPGNKFTSGSR